MKQIKIRKRSFPEWSAILLVLLPFGYSFLIDIVCLPRGIKFFSDFFLIASFAIVMFDFFMHRRFLIARTTSMLSCIIVAFGLYVLIAYVVNYQSVFYFIWGVRNNFRFYLAFLIMVSFLEEEDVDKCFNIMDILFYLNFVVVLIQFFFMGYKQDYLGGIFGVEKGCNGYITVFFCIVITKSLLLYMNGREKTFSCFLKCAIALLVSALSELKIFFLFFILILSIATVLTKFSIKKCIMILTSVLLIVVAYFILITLFDSFKGFLSVEYIIKEIMKPNYSSNKDIGRFTSIPTICQRFLPTTFDRLFGKGIGNCDTSALSIFNTDFYNKYADIHYSIFSVSFLLIEVGFIGLALFTSFFVVCLAQSIRFYKQKIGNMLFNQMGIIMSIICFILMFYNSSLRTESGYMIYFVLALPLIGIKNKVYDRNGNDI